MAVFKSDRLSEMRIAAGTVFALIDQEMKLHVAFCAKNGISEVELAATQEEVETLAYTRFVIDAGVRGDLLDLLVALAPCVLGYGEIGTTLAAQTAGATANHPYADWIATYAGDDYQNVCQEKEALLQSVFARLIGGQPEYAQRWPDLLKTFDTAGRLEAGFWSMGLRPGVTLR
jgi:thiaminase (transcriptional activator TenA)